MKGSSLCQLCERRRAGRWGTKLETETAGAQSIHGGLVWPKEGGITVPLVGAGHCLQPPQNSQIKVASIGL